MAKRKGGLQKKISSIFDGVHVPGSRKPDPPKTADRVSTDDAAAAPPTSKILSPETPKETTRPANKQNVRPSQVLRSRRRAERIKAEAEVTQKKESRQKVFTFMIPVLFAVLGYMIYDVFIAGTDRTDSSIAYKDKTEERKRAMAEAHSMITWKAPDVYPINLRDPMIENQADIYAKEQSLLSNRHGEPEKIYTKEEVHEKGLDIHIDGILYSEKKSSVVINGIILYEGHEIQGATIIKINKDSVEFERDGNKFTRP